MGQRDPYSLPFYSLPERDTASIAITGYRTFSDPRWHDVENGAGEVGPDDVHHLRAVAVHVVDPSTGEDFYRNLPGPFNDWEHFLATVQYYLDPYFSA